MSIVRRMRMMNMLIMVAAWNRASCLKSWSCPVYDYRDYLAVVVYYRGIERIEGVLSDTFRMYVEPLVPVHDVVVGILVDT